jgi:uncharacterized membrane protein YccF (DUF307 family)
MITLGNILWVVLGGWLIFLIYLFGSLILFITIIGIPFGVQTLKLAGLAIWPFGKRVEPGEKMSGVLHIIMNIIWIAVAGIEIAMVHAVLGCIFGLTIIGIPFAKQHFKLALVALIPFGNEVKTASGKL